MIMADVEETITRIEVEEETGEELVSVCSYIIFIYINIYLYILLLLLFFLFLCCSSFVFVFLFCFCFVFIFLMWKKQLLVLKWKRRLERSLLVYVFSIFLSIYSFCYYDPLCFCFCFCFWFVFLMWKKQFCIDLEEA